MLPYRDIERTVLKYSTTCSECLQLSSHQSISELSQEKTPAIFSLEQTPVRQERGKTMRYIKSAPAVLQTSGSVAPSAEKSRRFGRGGLWKSVTLSCIYMCIQMWHNTFPQHLHLNSHLNVCEKGINHNTFSLFVLIECTIKE